MVLRSRPESELKFHRVSRTFNTERRYVELYVDTLCSILLLTVCRTFIPSKEWDEDGTVAENVLLVRYPVFLFWYFWLVTAVRRPDPTGTVGYHVLPQLRNSQQAVGNVWQPTVRVLRGILGQISGS
jgi:hypothetical protein